MTPAGGALGVRMGVSFTVAFIGESTSGATRTVSFCGTTCGLRLTGMVPGNAEAAFSGGATDFGTGAGGGTRGFDPAEGASGMLDGIAGGLMGAGGRFAAASSVRGEGVIGTLSSLGSFRSAISTNSSCSART